MHLADGNKVKLLFLVHVVKVGLVLEKVGKQLLAGKGHVGLHVVGKFLDDQVVAFLGKQGLGRQHNVLMREGGHADNDVFSGERGGGQRQNHGQRQKQTFHKRSCKDKG